jgi:N-acyl-D-amino-acid deacylase
MSGVVRVLLLGVALVACTHLEDTLVEKVPPGVVIVNAQVIDGSGGPSRDVDVRIVGERIVAVGKFEIPAGDERVDAGGLVLAPGFIDAHSHHDIGLFEMPETLALVNQGVTTIVVGQDGSHPWPLEDFLARLESSRVAVNVASYAGHGTIRRRVMADDYRRPATAEENAAMAALLRTEMQAGALGLSSGLEYDPGSYAAPEELVALARVAASQGGRYISHIRSEDRYFWEAIDEIVDIGRKARLPVQVTHIKLAMPRWWGQAERLRLRLDEARAAGVDIAADIYPYAAWQTDFSWLRTRFPERDLDRRDGAEYILREMLAPERIVIPAYRPEPAYDGRTIAEIARLRGSDPETTLMELLRADVDAGSQSSMLGFAMEESDIESIMAWSHTVIGSDGELAGPHPRGYAAFTRYLGHYIRDRRVLGLEEGIRRISSLPAQLAGITDRGLIQVGHYADLVLFDPEQISARATYEQPHLPSTGVEKVWVNGELVLDRGRVTGKRPGMPIRRSGIRGSAAVASGVQDEVDHAALGVDHVGARIAHRRGPDVSRYCQQILADVGKFALQAKDTVFLAVHDEFRGFMTEQAGPFAQ